MDTKHLITFVTLAKEKTYMKTSAVLNYAPSTLTTHISKLEQELGVALFKTVDRQSSLTHEGKEFLPFALDILRTVEKAQETMDASSAGHRGTVTVVIMDSLSWKLAPLFTAFNRKFPDIELIIRSANSKEMASGVKENRYDAAFLYSDNREIAEGLDTHYVFYETLPFVVAPSHRLANKKEVGPMDLRHETFFQVHDNSYNAILKKLVKRENLQVRGNVQSINGNLTRRYALEGLGIAVLPQSLVEDDVVNGRLVCLNWTGKPLGVDCLMLTLSERESSPSAKEFIDFALHYYGRS